MVIIANGETGVVKGLEFFLPKSIDDKKVSVVEVGPFDENAQAKEINKFLGTSIESLYRINSYIMVHPPEITNIEDLLRGKPFVDPIMHQATLNEPLIRKLGIPYDFVFQDMLNPGTSDAEGDTKLRQTLLALGKKFEEGDVGFRGRQYFMKGKLGIDESENISAFLANPDLNQRLVVHRNEYERGQKVQVPVVTLPPKIEIQKYDVLRMSDDELLELSKTRKLAASLEEMQQFRDMYKDKAFIEKRKEKGLDERATDVELETWFGLRSEHCFHKEFNAHITLEDKVNDPIFKRAVEKGYLKKNDKGELILDKGIFKTFIQEPAQKIYDKLEKRGKNWIVAPMFTDNAGTVLYDENYMFCIKFETHNSPSNKEPVQGAKTGIDGVNRDIFGNMRGTFDAIANFFLYGTGNIDYEGWLPKGVKHPYVILKGATQGVREGGNESQIATLGGSSVFDPRNSAKCKVHAGTVGWSPVKSPDGISYIGKVPNLGDLVFVVGQPVGVDGVHGATESSLIADANISLGHVQADYSFIQAKAKGYILEVARDNLLSSITDFGAMGLGSASHEMAEATGGLFMDLALHPVKYKGIQPWQINCSETQDRMLLVAKPENKEELFNRAKLHDVDITQMGDLTDSGYVHLTHGEESAAFIDIKKLFNKEPRKKMHATWYGNGEKEAEEIKGEYSLEEALCDVIARPDIASKEWFFRQKDSSVKGATIQGPLIGKKQEVEADATIQKPLDTEGKDFGAIAYSFGVNEKQSDLDAYYSAQNSFLEMVGKVVAIGGKLPDMDKAKWDAWAVCGNYCQPNSESKTTLTKESGEHNLASLVREAMGVREAEEALNIPVISGKDSMKCSCRYEVDESFKLEDVPLDLRRHITLVEKDGKREIEIHDPDSYLATCAVKIEDYRKCVSSSFKQEGDLIYVLGITEKQLGASQYHEAMGYKEQGAPIQGGEVPKADLEEFIQAGKAVHAAIDNELVASCSYLHKGGLAVSAVKAAMAGDLGIDINVNSVWSPEDLADEELLFSETQGRYMVTVAKEDQDAFERTLNDVIYSKVGTVTSNGMTVLKGDGKKESIDISKVKESYQKTLSFGLNDLVKK